MNKKTKSYLIPTAFCILGLVTGLVVGMNFRQIDQKFFKDKSQSEANKLFTSQTATIRGQITAINGQDLTVKNSINNTVGNVKVSDRIVISKFSSNPSNAASPSARLKEIEFNKDVLISLELTNGTYEAIVIQYIAPPPIITSPPVE